MNTHRPERASRRPSTCTQAFGAVALAAAASLAGCTADKKAATEVDAAAPEPQPDPEAVARAEVDGVFERALGAHRETPYVGTLAEVEKRRVLRVGMLNNAASYFVYRGMEVGFQYELAELLTRRMQVRLEVYVPPRPADMRQLLEDRHVDVIPMGQAEAAADAGVLASRPFIFADHVIVQRADEPPITGEAQLAGRAIYLRRSSRYVPNLLEIQKRVPSLKVEYVSEETETEELIDQVAEGKIPLTVANSVLLAVEKTYNDRIAGTLVIARDQGLVYAVHRDAPDLAARIDRFVEREHDSADYRELHAKYFENTKRMAELRAGETGTTGAISDYDELTRTYGGQHDIDWRLILAQMYQESRFDPQARSWAGAVGLLQLMPRTAKELGVTKLDEPEQNIAGGVRYLRYLLDRFEPSLDMRQRVRFALASYNAGYYHVADARELARGRGLDPDRWFGNVEQAIQLLEKRTYYRKAKYGYCRGREPVAYVSRIQSKYDGYVAMKPEVSSARSP